MKILMNLLLLSLFTFIVQADDLQYITSPWSENTLIKSLATMHASRPVTDRQHPLWAWLCDRAIRMEELHVADSARNAIAKFKVRDGFFIFNDGTNLFVANQYVGLEFSAAQDGFRILSFYDLENKVDLVSKRGHAVLPWRINFLRHFNKAEDYKGVHFFEWQSNKESLQKLVNSENCTFDLPKLKTIIQNDQLSLTFQWNKVKAPELNGDFDIAMTVSLKKDDPLAYFRISRLENRIKDAGMVSIDAPRIDKFGYPSECDVVRSLNDFRGYKITAANGTFSGLYPAHTWSMQFLSASFGPSTAYLACHDPKANTKRFFLQVGEQFYFTFFVPNTGITGNSFSQDYDVVIGSVTGTWADAATKYRDWVIKNSLWCQRGPLINRPNINKKASEMAIMLRPDYDMHYDVSKRPPEIEKELRTMDKEQEVEKNLAFLGSQQMGIQWYTYYREIFDYDIPNFTPYPEIAGIFKKEAAQGITLFPYVNAEIWNVKLPSFAAIENQLCRQLDGGLFTLVWGANAPNAFLCPAMPAKKELAIKLAKQLKSINSDGIYLDVFSWNVMDCYDQRHQHPLGIGGDWYVRSQRKILKGISDEVGTDFGMMTEFFSEPYVDYFQQYLVSGLVDFREVPLVAMVYSTYTSQMAGRSAIEDSPTTFRVRNGRAVLWGNSLSGKVRSIYLKNESFRTFLKECVETRRALIKYLAYGQLLKPPKWSKAVSRIAVGNWQTSPDNSEKNLSVDAVESSMWRLPGANAHDRLIMLVNYSDKEEIVRFDLQDILPGKDTATLSYIRGITRENRGNQNLTTELTVNLPPASAQGLLLENIR